MKGRLAMTRLNDGAGFAGAVIMDAEGRFYDGAGRFGLAAEAVRLHPETALNISRGLAARRCRTMTVAVGYGTPVEQLTTVLPSGELIRS
jgi:hypothetical protein